MNVTRNIKIRPIRTIFLLAIGVVMFNYGGWALVGWYALSQIDIILKSR